MEMITLYENLSCRAQSKDVLKDVTKMAICLRNIHPLRTAHPNANIMLHPTPTPQKKHLKDSLFLLKGGRKKRSFCGQADHKGEVWLAPY